MSNDSSYGTDLTPLLKAFKARFRRLYGHDREWMPPSMRRPFTLHLAPDLEIDEFERSHVPPSGETAPAVVLSEFFPPLAYFVVADCECAWCRACRARGIPALARNPRI